MPTNIHQQIQNFKWSKYENLTISQMPIYHSNMLLTLFKSQLSHGMLADEDYQKVISRIQIVKLIQNLEAVNDVTNKISFDFESVIRNQLYANPRPVYHNVKPANHTSYERDLQNFMNNAINLLKQLKTKLPNHINLNIQSKNNQLMNIEYTNNDKSNVDVKIENMHHIIFDCNQINEVCEHYSDVPLSHFIRSNIKYYQIQIGQLYHMHKHEFDYNFKMVMRIVLMWHRYCKLIQRRIIKDYRQNTIYPIDTYMIDLMYNSSLITKAQSRHLKQHRKK